MKLFMAGPVTGYPNYKLNFNKVARKLQEKNIEFINPIKGMPVATKKNWTWAMKKTISQLLECNAILLLKDWEKSKGAQLEKSIAEHLGYTIYYESEVFRKKPRTIILIAGKKRSGKDTVADYLLKNIKKSTKASLAGEVKKAAKKDFKQLQDQLNKIFNDLMLYDLVTTNKHWGNEEKTFFSRSILQIYGTNIFRNRVDMYYWIKKEEQNIQKTNKDVIIIPDVRFPNELNYFKNNKSYNTISIKVNRNIKGQKDKHKSETALDNYKNWDTIINNNSTLEALRKKANKIISKIQN